MAKTRRKKAKAALPPVYTTPDNAVRPTPQRMGRGLIRMPEGPGRRDLPAHDMHHDCIAAMHATGLLSDDQEQAARSWQELKAAVRAELGINQGRSCLDIGPVGYDSDDGDASLMRRWRYVEAEMGSLRVGILDYTIVMGHKPVRMSLLQSSLDIYQRL